MIRRFPKLGASLLAMTMCVSLAWSTPLVAAEFSLVRAVPDEVFLVVASKNNPKKDFLNAYWGEVLDELKATGICDDMMELLGSVMGEDEMNEVTRLRDKAQKLIDAVNWEDLDSREFVFAERMAKPVFNGSNVNMGPPDILIMFRGGESVEQNYAGIVGIFQGMLDEINTAMNAEKFKLEASEYKGAKITACNFTAGVVGVPPVVLAVSRHEDVILVTLNEELRNQAIGLLSGDKSSKCIADNARFKNGFKGLAAADDEMVFFDMQTMLHPIRRIINKTIGGGSGVASEDHIVNSVRSGEAFEVCKEAWKAYSDKDYKKGLELANKAKGIAPDDSRVLYAVACFEALNGNKAKAVNALEAAVGAGFYAPNHMASDPDLDTLRDSPEFAKIMAHATAKSGELSREQHGDDDAQKLQFVNRMMDLPGLIDYTATTTRTEGHSVHTDSRIALIEGAKDKPFFPVFGGKMSVTPANEFANFLPSETVSYEVISAIDLMAFYDFVADSFKAFGPDGVSAWAEWERFQQNSKFDFKKEVLSWVDGGSSNVMLADGGWVSVMSVSDPKFAHSQISRAVEFLSTKVSEMAAQQPMLAMVAMRRVPVSHDTLEGFETIYSAMNPMPMAVWGVSDGKLLFGSSIEAIEMCLDTAKGKHPSIQENARLMSEAIVPDKNFFSATLTDQRNMGKELQAAIGMVSFMSGMMPMMIPDPEPRAILGKVAGMIAKLSPVVGKIDFYKSTSTCTTFDGQNFRMEAVTHYFSPDERKMANAL